eukprot:Rhum_TRINITY_DN15204_c1_g1::Rhum_TRINITY_DN15204_c1_g1_i4::g.143635::m.143635
MGFGAAPARFGAEFGAVATQVQRALEAARRVLSDAKDPTVAEDKDHVYEDKFTLAEFVTKAAAASVMETLTAMGMSEALFAELLGWAKTGQAVTLGMRVGEAVKFASKAEKSVEVLSTEVQRTSTKQGKAGVSLTESATVSEKVTEYLWTYTMSYELYLYKGDEDKPFLSEDTATTRTLIRTSCVTRVKTFSRKAPAVRENRKATLDLTWLLRRAKPRSDAGKADVRVYADGGDDSDQKTLQRTYTVDAHVDREDKECRTPYRNPEVQAAASFFSALNRWGDEMQQALWGNLRRFERCHDDPASEPVYTEKASRYAYPTAEGCFVPVLRLLQDAGEGRVETPSEAERVALVRAGRRSLQERLDELKSDAGAGNGMVSTSEVCGVVIADYLQRVASAFLRDVRKIEESLVATILAAVSETLDEDSFERYMQHHNALVYADEYCPKEFCHIVRRGRRAEGAGAKRRALQPAAPEGVFSIERLTSRVFARGTTPGKIIRVCSSVDGPARRFRVPVGSATEVAFHGECHVHSYVQTVFSEAAPPQHVLTARARQFSAFVLMLGTLGGDDGDVFTPTDALVLSSRDELVIPLLMDSIPTAKEFRDLVEQLSPEQQAFVKAYRGMQLKETLFAMCVVQVRPQLESVLNLPAGALTKEIRLTEELLDLFMGHEVAADLLSYEAEDPFADDDEVACKVKVDAVKGHVAGVKAALDASRDEEVAQAKREEVVLCSAKGTRGVGKGVPPEAVATGFSFGGGGATFGASGVVSGSGFGGGGTFGGGGGGAGGFGAAPAASAAASAAASGQGPPPWGSTSAAGFGSFAAQPGAVGLFGADSSAFGAVEPAQGPTQGPSPARGTRSTHGVASIPQRMEAAFLALDSEGCLRPTIVRPGDSWHKRSSKSLVHDDAEEELFDADDRRRERRRALDLLDALTRCGAIELEEASVHVVVAATNTFPKTLRDTLGAESVNPIGVVERSSLIATAVIHSTQPSRLLRADAQQRLLADGPDLDTEVAGFLE